MLCKNCEKWVFTLDRDFSWRSGLRIPDDMAFNDKLGVRRLELRRNGEIRVLQGYSWDGCTPKLCVLDLMIGIPDGAIDTSTKKPKTYYASLVHDALYQFVPDGLPLSRHDADKCFLKLMGETKFRLRHVYFAAVWMLGDLFRRAGKRIRRTKGAKILLESVPPAAPKS